MGSRVMGIEEMEGDDDDEEVEVLNNVTNTSQPTAPARKRRYE